MSSPLAQGILYGDEDDVPSSLSPQLAFNDNHLQRGSPVLGLGFSLGFSQDPHWMEEDHGAPNLDPETLSQMLTPIIVIHIPSYDCATMHLASASTLAYPSIVPPSKHATPTSASVPPILVACGLSLFAPPPSSSTQPCAGSTF